MKKGWETKDLATVSSINYGYTESASSKPVGPRFLRITDIQDDHVDWEHVPYCKIKKADLPKYRLASGDIVFARTGATTGKSFLVDDPPEAVFASYLIRLRLLDKSLLPEFVSLFFQTAGYWQSIKDGSSGSAQGGFNATKLGALRIPVPPLPEQQRIVSILDEAFERIATAKANAEKNRQSAGALFESHLQSVFTQRGKGWVVRKISEIARHSLGKMLDKAKNKGELQPYLRNINVRWFVFDLSDVLQMPFLPNESDKYTIVKGDVLICEGGYPGRAAIWNEEGAPLIIDQPEDDVDSKMSPDIVQQIWNAKSRRQLIFASHNANFVVNGDAELVMCCDYVRAGDQTGGQIKAVGAIDNVSIKDEITTVTEGGKEAFKLRMEKYGF